MATLSLKRKNPVIEKAAEQPLVKPVSPPASSKEVPLNERFCKLHEMLQRTKDFSLTMTGAPGEFTLTLTIGDQVLTATSAAEIEKQAKFEGFSQLEPEIRRILKKRHGGNLPKKARKRKLTFDEIARLKREKLKTIDIDRAKANHKIFAETWPNLFHKTRPAILKIGIDQDIASEIDLPREQIQEFFIYWTARSEYLKRLKKAEFRMDLQSNRLLVCQ